MSSKSITTINVSTQKSAVEAEYKALVTGLSTELAGESSLILAGTTHQRVDLIKEFQSRVDAVEATKTARNALHAAVAAEQALETRVAPLRAKVKKVLQARYGQSDPKMQLFGFAPAKVPQKTVAAMATGVAAAKATRTARHTMGKVQKSKITGASAATAPTAGSSTSTTAPAPAPSPTKTA